MSRDISSVLVPTRMVLLFLDKISHEMFETLQLLYNLIRDMI